MTFHGKSIVAHRGGKGRSPENSRAALEDAIEAGISWVEIDARLTKDNQVVIFHDATLSRTTNGCGFVHKLNLSQLRQYRLSNGETVPTLDEMLEIASGRANLWIDIKGGTRTAEAVVRVVQAKKVERAVVMSSLRPWVIRRIHQMSATVQTNLSAFISLYKVWLAKRLGARFVQPRFLLTKRFLAKARRANIHVITWPAKLEWLEPELPSPVSKALFLANTKEI